MQQIAARLEALNRSANTESDQGDTFANVLSGQISSSGSGDESGVMPYDPFATEGAGANAIYNLAGQIAQKHGLDPSLFQSLVQEESGCDPNVRPSKTGAMGVAQLMPATAAALGVTNPSDPVQSLNGGASLLAQLMKRYGGDARLALAAYNAGAARVDRAGGVPHIAETERYIRDILNRVAASKGQTEP